MSIKYILNKLANFYMTTDAYHRNLCLCIVKDKFEFDLKGTEFENEYGLYNLQGYIHLDKLNKVNNSNSFSYLQAVCDIGFLNHIGNKNIKCNFISNNMELDGIYTLNKSYHFDVDLYKYRGKFQYSGHDLDFIKYLSIHHINKLYLGDKTSVYCLDEIDLNNFNVLGLRERLNIINEKCFISSKEVKLCFNYKNKQIYDINKLKEDTSKVLQSNSILMKYNDITFNFNIKIYIDFTLDTLDGYFEYVENVKEFISYLMIYLKPYFNLKKSLRLYIHSSKKEWYIEVLNDTFFILRKPINWN